MPAVSSLLGKLRYSHRQEAQRNARSWVLRSFRHGRTGFGEYAHDEYSPYNGHQPVTYEQLCTDSHLATRLAQEYAWVNPKDDDLSDVDLEALAEHHNQRIKDLHQAGWLPRLLRRKKRQ